MGDQVPSPPPIGGSPNSGHLLGKVRLADIGIQWLLYPILVVYFLPVLAIAWAAIVTDGFRQDSVSVTFAQVMASEFYESLRQTIGVIFLPFLTAYAVKVESTQSKIPISTATLFFILLVFFVITVIVYGVVEIRQPTLDRFNTQIDGKDFSLRVFFKATTSTYAKELLAYIAVVLGVSLKK